MCDKDLQLLSESEAALYSACFEGKKWGERQMKSPGPQSDPRIAEFLLFSKFLVGVSH